MRCMIESGVNSEMIACKGEIYREYHSVVAGISELASDCGSLHAFRLIDFGCLQPCLSVSSIIPPKMGRSNGSDLPADRNVGVASNPLYDRQF